MRFWHFQMDDYNYTRWFISMAFRFRLCVFDSLNKTTFVRFLISTQDLPESGSRALSFRNCSNMRGIFERKADFPSHFLKLWILDSLLGFFRNFFTTFLSYGTRAPKPHEPALWGISFCNVGQARGLVLIPLLSLSLSQNEKEKNQIQKYSIQTKQK